MNASRPATLAMGHDATSANRSTAAFPVNDSS